ncbi:hypothetical protein AAFF_G00221320 [Aldrovandia affinis]|uniref:Uncharacterized protein n=1 Tax=Aldrovandia affinis TaxID=143900 RepID=A0AAD7RG33_9TELE|nr:hypothetical protein AAFF_G00221320 [Aldrovandia affinis]
MNGQDLRAFARICSMAASRQTHCRYGGGGKAVQLRQPIPAGSHIKTRLPQSSGAGGARGTVSQNARPSSATAVPSPSSSCSDRGGRRAADRAGLLA